MKSLLVGKNLESQKVEAANQNKNAQNHPDVLVLAWLYLVESVTTQEQTSRIESKILRLNSNSQEMLNNEIGRITDVRIPTLIQKYTTKHGVKFTVNVNEAKVEAAKVVNKQLDKRRRGIENSIIVLRQEYQVGATETNTQVNNMLQSVSEGSEMIKILKKVSMKIVNKQNIK